VADDDKKSSSVSGKLIATVFGAVIAPILVGLGLKVLPDYLVGKSSPTTGNAPSTQVADATPTTPKKKTGESSPPPPGPTHRVRPPHSGKVNPSPGEGGNSDLNLITPKLGDNFYSFAWSEMKKIVKSETVDPAMFKYTAAPPSITVSGAQAGALMTRKEHENYSLTVEFRWGNKTYPPRENKPRAAAILLHATGPEGVYEKIWPQSIAVLLNEGDLGTIQLRGAPGKIECSAKMKESPDKRREYVGGEVFGLPLVSGKPVGWNNFLYRLASPDGDPAKPGDWNKVLVTCDEDVLSVVVNDKTVNEIKGLNIKKGHVGFTSQHADYTLRKVELETFRK
jgi:hypothetical protein